LLFDPQALNTVVLTVHEGMVPHFVSAGVDGRNIRTLRNPVTPWRTDRVPAERNRNAFFVGRLDQDKGVDLLAQAARQAGVPLELIGDGPLATPLARAYPEIRQHGWQPPGRISELIGSARLLVLPTRCRETFGLVALEAAMSGIPVVVSPFAAIGGEVVRHGFGCVADPYDQEAFAGLLRDLAKDDRTVEEMSWRAFANARALAPTPARWCDDLVQLYAERLGGVGCKPPTRSEPRWQTRAQTDADAAMRIHEIG
jgi:glycosyltransferase involved in cell wall biosynthesis